MKRRIKNNGEDTYFMKREKEVKILGSERGKEEGEI